MPMPVRPSSSAQPLFGSKRLRDGPAPSHSVDSPSSAPPLQKVRMNEIERQRAETSETVEKRGDREEMNRRDASRSTDDDQVSGTR